MCQCKKLQPCYIYIKFFHVNTIDGQQFKFIQHGDVNDSKWHILQNSLSIHIELAIQFKTIKTTQLLTSKKRYFTHVKELRM